MRTELAELFAAAGVPAATESRLSWERVILTNNTGRISVPGLGKPEAATLWGFHLVILGNDGRPEYYCKCRPSHPSGGPHRESRYLEYFGGQPDARRFVSEAISVRNTRIDIQVSRFIDGDRLDRVTPSVEILFRSGVIERVLDASHALSQAALRFPEGGDRFGQPFSLGDEAAPLLEDLPALGLSASIRPALLGALSEVEPIHPSPQHRDLWPNNVLITSDGVPKIVDLDSFGEVRVPMVDAFHLVRTLMDLEGQSNPGPWISRMDTSPLPARSLLRSECGRRGLSPLQSAGCLLFYLLDIAVATYRRGVPEAFWDAFRREIPEACRRLEAAGSLAGFAELQGLTE